MGAAEKIERYESKPLLKVTGRPIQLLLECDTVATVRAKLTKYGLNADKEYVKEEEVINKLAGDQKEEPEVYVSYKSKSSQSGRL